MKIRKNTKQPHLSARDLSRRFPAILLFLLLFAAILCTSCTGPAAGSRPASDGQSPSHRSGPAAGAEPQPGPPTSAEKLSEELSVGRSQDLSQERSQGLSQEPSEPSSDRPAAPEEGPRGPSLKEARALAQKISAGTGLTILCGEDVPLTYADFTARHLTDPEKILGALKILDRTLALYPPGFFSAVREGFCQTIAVCLARDLHTRSSDSYMESANAFTTVENDTIWLVLNADQDVSRGTLIHEITHVTDYRLLGMHQLHESEWNRLNPGDFSYYNAYLDAEGTDLRISADREYTSFLEEDPARIWFYDPYSKTFAMEDRARLMEKLLEDENAAPDRCFLSPHIRTKLRFYFYTLRQAFENSRWPEETSWEALLRSVEDSS